MLLPGIRNAHNVILCWTGFFDACFYVGNDHEFTFGYIEVQVVGN